MPWLLLVAIVLLAFNLRGPIVALAPVLAEIRADLGLSATAAGLLTTLPVLCFAVASPFAVGLIARAGAERAVLISLAGVLLGTVVRALGGYEFAIAGVLILGVAITIGNVVVPVIVRRDFPPGRVGIVTGTYTAAMNVGSMLTSLATAPLADLIGWRAAVTSWAILVVIAAIVWGQAAGWRRSLLGEGREEREAQARDRVPHTASWRSLTAWLLTLALAGQTFSYYGITAWLPTLVGDRLGISPQAAGAGSSLFQLLAVVGALGVPLLAGRWRPWHVMTAISLAWIVTPLGLLFAPELWIVWSSIGGAAQGGGITIIFMIIVRMSTSDAQARGLSAFVQGVGYAVAATGPIVIGAVHELSGDWIAPMIVITISVLALAGFGIASALRAEARHPTLPHAEHSRAL
jgi:CP family cyanate transporter-like MFS transporter